MLYRLKLALMICAIAAVHYAAATDFTNSAYDLYTGVDSNGICKVCDMCLCI